MNKIKKFIIHTLLIAIAISFPLMAIAQTTGGYYPVPTPGKITTPGALIAKIAPIAEALYKLLFAIAVLFFLMAAFSYLFSGGDPGKIKKASAQLLYAVIAIVVGFFAFSITKIVEGFLK